MKAFSILIILLSQIFFAKISFAGVLVVADKAKGFVYLLDSKTFSELAQIKVADSPQNIAISPSGKFALVSHYKRRIGKNKSQLSLINLQTGKVTLEAPLYEKANPKSIIFVNEDQALVLCEGTNSLLLYNIKEKKIEGFIKLKGKGSHVMVRDEEQGFLYVANNQSGTLLKVEISHGEQILEKSVGKGTKSMALNKKGNHLYVINRDDDYLSCFDTTHFHLIWKVQTSKKPTALVLFDQDKFAAITSSLSGKVDVIDTENGSQLHRFNPADPRLKVNIFPTPETILNFGRNKALVANLFKTSPFNLAHLSLVNLKTGEVLRKIPAGLEPEALAFSPITFGDPQVTNLLRTIEEKQCARTEEGHCYDREGFPKRSLQRAYAVIEAPMNKVWQTLTDLDSYHRWNPFMVEPESSLRVGHPFSFKVILNPKTPKVKLPLNLDIISREEDRSLCWGNELLGEAFVVKRCFNLYPLGDGRTLYYTKERFKGLLSHAMSTLTGKSIREGIRREAMALKTFMEKG